MAEVEEVHVDDEGTDLEYEVKDQGVVIDVSGYTITLYYRLPGTPTAVSKAADLSDPTNGIVKYTTEASFLSVEGDWFVQAYVDPPGAGTGWWSDVDTFHVYPNLA